MGVKKARLDRTRPTRFGQNPDHKPDPGLKFSNSDISEPKSGFNTKNPELGLDRTRFFNKLKYIYIYYINI